MEDELLKNSIFLANKFCIEKLKGVNEFYKNKEIGKNIYYINVITNKKKEENMINIINHMQNINNIIIGIDFEFNKVSKTDREVALMQINIESSDSNGYIFILNPNKLDSNTKKIFIEFITRKDIIKVLHGSESLDIPYLFKQFFETKEHIDNFCHNLYDTKYYCDYNNINNKKLNKCGIYDLLYYYKIIDANKIKYFEKLEKKLGPLYNITININKLSDNLLKYCYYDVIYLPSLIKKILLKKNDVYKFIIPEISSIIHKYKNDNNNIFNELINEIGKINTTLINNKIAINYFKDFMDKYPSYFHNLDKINYFKKTINVLVKLFIYNNLLNKNTLSKYIKYISKYPHIYNLLFLINKYKI
jgi:hypothetical protein